MEAMRTGNSWALYNVDCVEAMHEMPENSVDCSVFSPPFGDLFVYSESERDIGNSQDSDLFFEHYGFFVRALFKVMKPGRMTCVHCSDLLARKVRDGFIGMQDFSGALIKAHQDAGFIYHSRVTIWKDPVTEMQRTKALGLLHKQIRKDSAMCRVGMPDYVLFFRKPGENPEPIRHATDKDETLKIAKAWLKEIKKQGLLSHMPDDDLLEEFIEQADFPVEEWQKLASPVWMTVDQTNVVTGFRNARSCNDERHVCPLQLDVIENCLRLYTKPGDIVLDPFNGVGSTGYQALKMHRRYIGFELKKEYFDQANILLEGCERQKELFVA